jgi:hypothetical protein
VLRSCLAVLPIQVPNAAEPGHERRTVLIVVGVIVVAVVLVAIALPLAQGYF